MSVILVQFGETNSNTCGMP